MQQVHFHVPDEIAAFVAKTARARKQSEPSVWREVVMLGVRGLTREIQIGNGDEEATARKIDLLLRTAIQTLTTTRRLTGHIKEDLVVLAKQDALAILESVEVKNEHF